MDLSPETGVQAQGLRPAVCRPFTHRHAQGRWTGLGWRLKPVAWQRTARPGPGALGSQQAPYGLGHWVGVMRGPGAPAASFLRASGHPAPLWASVSPHGQSDGPCCAAKRVEIGRGRGGARPGVAEWVGWAEAAPSTRHVGCRGRRSRTQGGVSPAARWPGLAAPGERAGRGPLWAPLVSAPF